MKRTVLILVLVSVCGAGVLFIRHIASNIARGEDQYFQMVQEGKIFEDALHAHDRSLNVGGTSDGHGKTDIVILEVFDTERQDQIIAWAKAAKAEAGIRRPIVISFQHEIPHSDQPDVMLREVEF
jgi:hypothetical protein